MKLLIDMNLSPRWAELMTEAGFEAVHWSSIGVETAPDATIMAYASENQHVVLTHDLDFSAILAASAGEAPSVVQIRAVDLSPETLGALVIEAIRRSISELEAGALLTIDAHRSRLRVLPLVRPD